MMKKIEDLNYYELLEIGPSATSQEIHKAYERARRVYEPNSVALYSLFTSEETAAIHQRIEDAYRTLVYEDNRKIYDAELRERHEMPEPPAPPPPPSKYHPLPVQPAFTLPSENRYLGSAEPRERAEPAQAAQPPDQTAAVSSLVGEFTGQTIRLLREQRGLNLRAIADTTKIGARYLEWIELETFDKLPARPYLRGFLVLYAKTLGCEPERMCIDYLKRYDAAAAGKQK